MPASSMYQGYSKTLPKPLPFVLEDELPGTALSPQIVIGPIGDLSEVAKVTTSGAGSVTISTTFSNGGSYSYEFTAPATGATCYASLTYFATTGKLVADGGLSLANPFYISFDLWIIVLPSNSESVCLIGFSMSGTNGSNLMYVVLSTSAGGNTTLGITGVASSGTVPGPSQLGSTVLAASTRYRIGIKMTPSASVPAIALEINGNAETSYTSSGMVSPVNSIYIGKIAASAGNSPITYYISNIMLDLANYPPTNAIVQYFVYSSVGQFSQWTGTPSITIPQNPSGAITDGTSGHLTTIVTTANVSALSTTYAVQAMTYAEGGNSGNSIGVVLYSGGVTSVTTGATGIQSAYTLLGKCYANDPNGNGLWTVSNTNAAQPGVKNITAGGTASDSLICVAIAYSPSSSPSFSLEQEEIYPSLMQQQEATPWTSRQSFDEDPGTQLLYFYLEQQELYPLTSTATVWISRPFLDEDPYPTPPVIALEDERSSFVPTESQPWLSRSFLDDETGSQLTYFYLEQEEPWTGLTQSVTWVSRPFSDDEVGPATYPFIESEDLQPTFVTVQPWVVRPFLDDEISTNLKDFYLEQEEPWVGLTQSTVWTPRPFLDDEAATATFPFLELEDLLPKLTQAIPWVARPFIDDEIGSPLANFYLDQEEPWLAQVEVRPWVSIAFPYDETSSGLTNFPLEQEEPYKPLTQATVWAAQTFLDEDPLSYVVPFYLDQEEDFPSLFARQSLSWNSWFATDVDEWVLYVTPALPTRSFGVAVYYTKDFGVSVEYTKSFGVEL